MSNTFLLLVTTVGIKSEVIWNNNIDAVEQSSIQVVEKASATELTLKPYLGATLYEPLERPLTYDNLEDSLSNVRAHLDELLVLVVLSRENVGTEDEEIHFNDPDKLLVSLVEIESSVVDDDSCDECSSQEDECEECGEPEDECICECDDCGNLLDNCDCGE